MSRPRCESGCGRKATFEIQISPRPGCTADTLADLAPWLHFGVVKACERCAASVTDKMMSDPKTVLHDYDIEHDPRMYVS